VIEVNLLPTNHLSAANHNLVAHTARYHHPAITTIQKQAFLVVALLLFCSADELVQKFSLIISALPTDADGKVHDNVQVS
jgi:hypothetical protein